MLIAIVTILVILTFGGSNNVARQYDVADDRIKKVVTDRQHRDQALAIVKEMKKTAEASAKDQRKSVESLQRVLDRRTASNDEIETAMQPLSVNNRATTDKLLDLRFQLSGVLTRQEWEQVFAPPPPPAAAK